MKKLTSLDNFILETISKKLANKGYKLTHDQIYDHIKKVSSLDVDFNHTHHNISHLWTMYNSDPPKPPYKYYFETQDEAVSFASKAKKKYNVNCDIDLVNFRKWKLTTVKN